MSRMINTIKSKTATAAIGAMMAAGGTPPVGVWNPMRNSCTEETLTEKLADSISNIHIRALQIRHTNTISRPSS